MGELNRALQTPDVLYTALRRAGCCPQEHIEDAVSALTRQGEYFLPPVLGLLKLLDKLEIELRVPQVAAGRLSGGGRH